MIVIANEQSPGCFARVLTDLHDATPAGLQEPLTDLHRRRMPHPHADKGQQLVDDVRRGHQGAALAPKPPQQPLRIPVVAVLAVGQRGERPRIDEDRAHRLRAP